MHFNKLYIHFQHAEKQCYTLAVSLSELDLDLPSADPLPVQVMKRILCVTNILEHAAAVKALLFLFYKSLTHTDEHLYYRHWTLHQYDINIHQNMKDYKAKQTIIWINCDKRQKGNVLMKSLWNYANFRACSPTSGTFTVRDMTCVIWTRTYCYGVIYTQNYAKKMWKCYVIVSCVVWRFIPNMF